MSGAPDSGRDSQQSEPVLSAADHNESDNNYNNNNNADTADIIIKNSTEEEKEADENVAVDPYSVIKRVQCPSCSRPLRVPLRLPCGNTLCRACLPPVVKREGISYPRDERREDGFMCPWKDRGCKRPEGNGSSSSAEHSMGDCGVDVTVGKVNDVIEKVLEDNAKNAIVAPVSMKWVPSTTTDESLTEPKSPPMAQEAILNTGRYLGIYNLMKEGSLPYDIENVTYENIDSDAELQPAAEIDDLVFQQLKHSLRSELDCQVCYGLMVDPLTSPCGHTFCRRCVARVLDHSNLCPICRRKLSLPLALMLEPINRILNDLINNLYPTEIESRRATMTQDTLLGEDKDLPLFVCTLSFPSMPTFLHVFEPRYRLMIRRALEDGGRKFGMVTYNYVDEPPETVGRTQFMQYGTILSINGFDLLPDGRSLLRAVGVSKFKVVDSGVLDGYYIAKTERVDDIGLAQEEDLERRDIAAATAAATTAAQGNPGDETPELPLEALSTQQLMQICLEFVERRRTEGAPWLHPRVLLEYGQPPTDPALFPYWLASVLPISEEEKYLLLPLTSVRERLKVTTNWVKKLDSMEWYFPPSIYPDFLK
jgi:Lon protease-like protein